MTQEDSPTQKAVLAPFDLLEGASESTRAKTAETFLELLGARVRNPNTRSAYRVAWRSFLAFCSARQLELESVKAYHVGAWLDQHLGSRSTQRQHLAALRLLFDSLMMRGVVEYNPAARARPPRLVRESSQTPVFEEAEIVAFLDSIGLNSLKDIRDKALFCVLLYSWCRVSALINLSVGDYYERGGTRWLRFQEKRGKQHEVPVHSKAKEAVDLWLERSYLASKPSAPLFPSFGKNRETVELRRLDRRSVLKLVEKRAKASGILKQVCCHSFRATGVTEYMNSGGTIEIAQRIAGHTSPSTTRIYDRSGDQLTLQEIERVQIGKKQEIWNFALGLSKTGGRLLALSRAMLLREPASFILRQGSSPALTVKIVGGGSQYAVATLDADGDYLNGSKTYRMHFLR
jgi:integrase/recombinase XerD